EIKTEVATIETTVLSPTFGLAEIKTEIDAIQVGLGITPNKTTGVAALLPGVSQFQSRIFNNTTTDKIVTATIYQLSPTVPKVAYATLSNQTIAAGTAFNWTVANTLAAATSYEVVFEGLDSGVYAWTTTNNVSNVFNEANTFRNSELVPYIS
ncbi:hypothetical protein ACWO4B_003707, partial [Clostridium sporogenes]